MYVKQLETGVLAVRLVRGEEICKSIEHVCRVYAVRGGTVMGIGTTDSAVIGVYNLSKKAFEGKEVNTFCEIAGLSGNISVKDGECIAHIHAVLADADGKVYAGHLKSGMASATAEIFIQKTDGINKFYDEKTGLNLFDFSPSALEKELKDYLISNGATDVGFCKYGKESGGLNYAVSIVLCDDKYFENYNAVNSKVQKIADLAEQFLKEHGYKAKAVDVTSFRTESGETKYSSFSHKRAAVLSGLGVIGKNSMFIHKSENAAILASVKTDCVFSCTQLTALDLCKNCSKCKDACPAGSIKGKPWYGDQQLDAEKCAAYMRLLSEKDKEKAACARCVKVCPFAKRKKL